MLSQTIAVKRALVSVSDKRALLELAQALVQLNIEIISTGGTSQYLKDANIPTTEVATVTQFPEMMNGRVKTLHPKIHGGILGQRDQDAAIAKEHNIEWIDLVIVNLYPFANAIKNPEITIDDAIEQIDIGGSALIRSAAKNMRWVGIVTDPDDYEKVLLQLRDNQFLTFEMRKQLAIKAFAHTAQYDQLISEYLGEKQTRHFSLEKITDLRYGENPHQAATAYRLNHHSSGILSAKQHQGKSLSYNNIADADAAMMCVKEFTQSACVIVKHGNPCGAAVGSTIEEAYQAAWSADSLSAFGGVVALNQTCTKNVAEKIATVFCEVLIAPAYEQSALEILASRTNLRVLELDIQVDDDHQDLKFISGGVLIQQKDRSKILLKELKVVTKTLPTQADLDAMLFAWPILKHIKSNGILIAKQETTVGIGAGQVSRIDAVEMAIRKSKGNTHGAILASDAFFPFRDGIDCMADTGIRAVMQPGGSVRDQEVIAACDEYGIAMVFTGMRCFKH